MENKCVIKYGVSAECRLLPCLKTETHELLVNLTQTLRPNSDGVLFSFPLQLRSYNPVFTAV